MGSSHLIDKSLEFKQLCSNHREIPNSKLLSWFEMYNFSSYGLGRGSDFLSNHLILFKDNQSKVHTVNG